MCLGEIRVAPELTNITDLYDAIGDTQTAQVWRGRKSVLLGIS
jgi:hypothetical protein